jgi:hypothetical protein
VGKISASWATTSVAATQTAEVKKKKRKRTRSVTTVNSDVKTINFDDEEGGIESPKAAAAPSAGTPRRAASLGKQVLEMPRQASKTQERPQSSTDPVGDLGSHKRAKKVPPKPCKLGLRSATK